MCVCVCVCVCVSLFGERAYFNVFSLVVGEPCFELAKAWPACLFAHVEFFNFIFKGWLFKSATTYCQVYLFYGYFLHKIFISRSMIKFLY